MPKVGSKTLVWAVRRYWITGGYAEAEAISLWSSLEAAKAHMIELQEQWPAEKYDVAEMAVLHRVLD